MWAFAVYFPACHMVWGGAGGFFADMGVLDFAGGIVVHITAGIGALVGAIMLGPRKENKLACGNITLTCLGTGMLWVRLRFASASCSSLANHLPAYVTKLTNPCRGTERPGNRAFLAVALACPFDVVLRVYAGCVRRAEHDYF